MVDVLSGIGNYDYATRVLNETTLVVREDGLVVRLWKRPKGLQVSLPMTRDELTASEAAAVAQHELGVGS